VAVRAPVEPHERLSLNLAALATGRAIYLLVNGGDKLAVLERAREGSEASLPVAALLALQPPPEIFWAP
jgi:6-phosphogluconolactonase/glucosamine-6-phosphate isomerase/deaminase